MNDVKTGDYIKIVKASPFDEAVGIRVGNIEKVTSVIGNTVYISAGFSGEVSLAPTHYVKLGEKDVKEYFDNIEKLATKRELMLVIISIIEESVHHSPEDIVVELQKAKSYLEELIEIEKELLAKQGKETKDEHY